MELDSMTNKALANSEIFQEYAKRMQKVNEEKQNLEKEAELARMEEEQEILARSFEQLIALKEAIASSPLLKCKFEQAAKMFKDDPSLAKKADQNFVNGLILLGMLESNDY